MLLFSLYKISIEKEPVKKEMYLQILGGKDGMNINFKKIIEEFDPEIVDFTSEWDIKVTPEPQEVAEEKEPA